MRKNFVFTGWLLLCVVLGCKSITTTQEDLLFKARQIKASAPSETQEERETIVPQVSLLPDQETLVYRAKFIGLSIGTFVITNNGKMMLGGREAYYFEIKVRTLPFFSLLFKTKARYVSYMDAQELVVLRHEEYIKGGDVLESTVDFNYQDLTATYQNVITHQERTVKIPGKLLDPLSGGFYLRTLPLKLGDTVELNIYADQKIYKYTGLLSSKTTVDVPKYGKQEAYRFDPYLFLDGEQIKKISAKLFFSTTTPTKTLRASLKTLLGDVHVVLVEGKTP